MLHSDDVAYDIAAKLQRAPLSLPMCVCETVEPVTVKESLK